jgi:hypothetical protein
VYKVDKRKTAGSNHSKYIDKVPKMKSHATMNVTADFGSKHAPMRSKLIKSNVSAQSPKKHIDAGMAKLRRT